MEDLSPSCLCMNIHDIYIEEPYRKQGIASELFTYAEELARKNGANLLRSGTSVDNIKSIALHEKAGFSKHRYEFEKILK